MKRAMFDVATGSLHLSSAHWAALSGRQTSTKVLRDLTDVGALVDGKPDSVLRTLSSIFFSPAWSCQVSVRQGPVCKRYDLRATAAGFVSTAVEAPRTTSEVSASVDVDDLLQYVYSLATGAASRSAGDDVVFQAVVEPHYLADLEKAIVPAALLPPTDSSGSVEFVAHIHVSDALSLTIADLPGLGLLVARREDMAWTARFMSSTESWVAIAGILPRWPRET